VTWQLSAFGLLGLGLFAGFAWYERTRPDARIVALVGTLAAFAALGRIAFAAVPNVKPTSDIVLISGYALGGAPGYVVGAVAALVSNFFFGQGPWTPWQMAGWGVTGIAGALLARLTRGRIGRLPLALVSFVLGFAFTALQDAGDWVTYSDHSLGQLGVYVGKGVGFDLVHAAGCFAFAMLFGPALIRTLQRFRTRIQVTWLAPAARVGIPALFAALVVAGGLTRPAATAAASPHASPVQYLEASQNRDGGWGAARGQSSNSMYTAWAILGLDAAHVDAAAVRTAGRNGYEYLGNTIGQDTDPGSVERTILAVVTAGVNPLHFSHVNLIHRLERFIRPNGSIENLTNLTTFGVLALEQGDVLPSRRMIAWLVHQQDRDGGFNFGTRGGSSDVDDTGAVLSVLGQSSIRREYPNALRRAVGFLRAQQNHDGGFGDQQRAASNAQSTAFAVCGLDGAGIKAASFHRPGAPSPLAYLRSLIQADGAVDYARANSQSPVWVTAEAEIALAGGTL
jgi:energy-coupling factor transport system substrate-specific component